ncbi:SDR family NAD(P)-dependent oxidoreductase [Rhizorhabdus histidinilytica]|uniref:SDR family NAD(P)-dependent oxidoreductase n=1 Tax=Rhizorhabdus histidinilytica TaxID=439228 RepID=UPI00322013F6
MAEGDGRARGGRLAGRVALVTGCGRLQGIGRAVALDLAAAGADVAVTDLRVDGVRNVADTSEAEAAIGWRGLPSLVEEVRAMGRRAVALTGDISDEADAGRMVGEAIAALGRVDILVNNAGAPHGPDRGPSWEIPIDAFDAVMRINARGAFLMSRAVIRHLLARRAGGEEIAGRIVNIASGAGKRGVPERAAYCASKFAVVGLTQTLAQELGAMDVTVNAVCPGAIATARAASREKRKAEAGVAFEFIKSAVPRIGTGHDIARAVTFLAEPEASFVTGQSIMVDGGMLML